MTKRELGRVQTQRNFSWCQTEGNHHQIIYNSVHRPPISLELSQPHRLLEYDHVIHFAHRSSINPTNSNCKIPPRSWQNHQFTRPAIRQFPPLCWLHNRQWWKPTKSPLLLLCWSRNRPSIKASRPLVERRLSPIHPHHETISQFNAGYQFVW